MNCHTYTEEPVTVFIDPWIERDLRQDVIAGLNAVENRDSFSETVVTQVLDEYILLSAIEKLGTQFFTGKYAELLRKRGIRHMRILYAHGSKVGNSWHFSDGGELRPLNSWIRSNDTNPAICLALVCCNKSSLSLRTKRCPLIIPDRVVGNREQQEEDAIFTLYLPDIDTEVDSNTLDHYLSLSSAKVTATM